MSCETIRVACIGDSLTRGDGSHEHARRRQASLVGRGNYPSYLQELLGQRFDVKNFGHGGTTACNDSDSPYTRTREWWRALRFQPHMVVLMLGTNDANGNAELANSVARMPPSTQVFMFEPQPRWRENGLQKVRECGPRWHFMPYAAWVPTARSKLQRMDEVLAELAVVAKAGRGRHSAPVWQRPCARNAIVDSGCPAQLAQMVKQYPPAPPPAPQLQSPSPAPDTAHR